MQDAKVKISGHSRPYYRVLRFEINLSFKSCLFISIQKNVDCKQLVAIGCDGTAINTGWKNGIIHNIEVKVECFINGLYA